MPYHAPHTVPPEVTLSVPQANPADPRLAHRLGPWDGETADAVLIGVPFDLGARLGAASMDHLEHMTADGWSALAAADPPPLAVLLPGVNFHLAQRDIAPARELVAAGVPVALATDFNPGSAFSPSMPMIIALATRTLGMTVAEAIVATTINAAHAIGLGGETGSLEAGKRADLLICDLPNHVWLGYSFGWNPVKQVIAGGRIVVGPDAQAPAPD